jgi:hypothetical protein
MLQPIRQFGMLLPEQEVIRAFLSDGSSKSKISSSLFRPLRKNRLAKTNISHGLGSRQT